jgi:hypothetical protein
VPPDAGRAPYYLENFERILATVAARYDDLLAPPERAFARDLAALALPARCLYVRLVSRRGPFFRARDLRYAEIADLAAAADELAAGGFLDLAPAAAPDRLLLHLRRDEIDAIAADLGVVTVRGAKAQAIAALTAAADAGDLRQAIRRRVPLVEPLRLDQVTLHRLLFFGNLHQDWTELVLADLGVWRYESYPLRRDLRLYPTRAAIDDAIAVRRLAAAVREHLAAGDRDRAFAVAAEVARRDPPWDAASRPLAEAILLEVGRPLERDGRLAEALELYSGATVPPARERRARLYARAGRERAAIALCREIADAPRDETERWFARRFEQRLRRRIGQVPAARRRYRAARRIALAPDPGSAVEHLALAHFARQGRDGFHAENWLWLALYGLAFWDVVFAPVEGAFQHAFQDAPLDLGDPVFRPRREAAIVERLEEIAAGEWPAARLLAVWRDKHGIRNRLVPWWPSLPPLVELALSRLEGPHLAAVCDRLSRDLGRYGRGFPDLFVLGPDPRGFELYEVKSPGDRLRPEQIGWLDYLRDRGLPCSVLTVEWSTPAVESIG